MKQEHWLACGHYISVKWLFLSAYTISHKLWTGCVREEYVSLWTYYIAYYYYYSQKNRPWYGWPCRDSNGVPLNYKTYLRCAQSIAGPDADHRSQGFSWFPEFDSRLRLLNCLWHLSLYSPSFKSFIWVSRKFIYFAFKIRTVFQVSWNYVVLQKRLHVRMLKLVWTRSEIMLSFPCNDRLRVCL